jgi:hypothetical protein
MWHVIVDKPLGCRGTVVGIPGSYDVDRNASSVYFLQMRNDTSHRIAAIGDGSVNVTDDDFAHFRPDMPETDLQD